MYDWKTKEEDIKATNAIFLGDAKEEQGTPFRARFLQAGLVKYDFGICLLKKETIDKFINTFINCPVIFDHSDDIKPEDEHGKITNIWFAPEDGWFWCSGHLDDEGVYKVQNGYNVSCQYRITEISDNDEGRLHNGNPYDKEILNGVFEHLAIVKNPRYEDAFIAVNAILADAKTTDFQTEFKDLLYTVVAEGIYKRLGELRAKNEDKWITLKPHGKEADDYKRLKIREGETVEEAMHRQGYYSKRQAKDEKKQKQEDIYQKDIDTLTEKRTQLVKEFNKNPDYFRKKEIIQENNNIIAQIRHIQGKQTAQKREKLLKNAGDYSKKLASTIKKNEKIINSIVNVENNLQEETDKWVEIGKQQQRLKDEYTRLRSLHGKDNFLVILKEQDLHKNYLEYSKQRDIVNAAKQEKYKTINKVLRIDNGANIEFQTTTKSQEVKNSLQLSKDLLDGIISKNIMPNEPIKAMAIKGGKGRPHYSRNSDRLEMTNKADAPDVAHEIMHWLEKKNPNFLNNSLTFLEYRTQGEKAQKLKDITKLKFDDDEIAKPDKFFDPYCGKIYSHQATEIMSMGIERIFEHPKEFAETDREYMSFVISNLRGEL